MPTSGQIFRGKLDEECYQNHYQDVITELQAIPEVEGVERIKGMYELLVRVKAPMRVVFVVNKILPMDWVKHVTVLKVEPFKISEYDGLSYSDLIRLRRVIGTEANG